MSDRWAAVRNGEIIYGPGPLPYFWTDPATGDPHQMNALTLTERAALGWQLVEIRGARDIDPAVEMELQPTVTLESGSVVETKQYAYALNARNAMLDRTDEWAERVRTQVAQSRPLQTMVYQIKAAEAEAALEDPQPTEEEYPLLAASIGIEGTTLRDVANTVLEARKQWIIAAADVERARLLTRKLIGEAASNDEAKAIHANTNAQASLAEVALNFRRPVRP